ncbi:hypothetical protein CRUP_013966 [Coryphaenoides rupestris]|nr:hypothetical protein CRUP_013966 [Coryphaenoides rupestris]
MLGFRNTGISTTALLSPCLLHVQDFRRAAEEAVGEGGEPAVEEQRLEEILGVLPQVYSLHSGLLAELEARISQWEDSQRLVDVLLSRREDFGLFDTYISEYDRSMYLLEDSSRNNPAFAAVVKTFECLIREAQPDKTPTVSLS